jgi:hypothetical protein
VLPCLDAEDAIGKAYLPRLGCDCIKISLAGDTPPPIWMLFSH